MGSPAFLDHVICGEETDHRVHEARDSVLARFGVHPKTAATGGFRRDWPDARNPGFREETSRLPTEGPDEVLDSRARGESNAVDLAVIEHLLQPFLALARRYQFVGRRDHHLGSGLTKLLRQDFAGHLCPWDQHLLARQRVLRQRPDQGLRLVLLGCHVYAEPRPFDFECRRRAYGRYLRPPWYRPEIPPMISQTLHKRLYAVHAGKDDPVEGVEAAYRFV